MRPIFHVAQGSMVFIVACGPRSGLVSGTDGTPELVCSGGASIGAGNLDPGFGANTILEPVDVDCRWEGTAFPMYRRSHDGALFYRPLLSVVKRPEVDRLFDPAGRTVTLRVLMAAPDPSAACRPRPGREAEPGLASARPLPLTRFKLKLESPVSSGVCEMGDGSSLVTLADEELVHVRFDEADQAGRFVEALEKDLSLMALRGYYESVGHVRALRCGVDAMALGHLDEEDLVGVLASAGLTSTGTHASLLLLAGDPDEAHLALAGALEEALVDFVPRTCPADMAASLADGLLAKWSTPAVEPPGGTLVAVGDVTLDWLEQGIAAAASLLPVADEVVVRGGCCEAGCDGCCDERADCLLAPAQTEDRCGTGHPGDACVVCEADRICKDSKCWTPPYMDARYELTLVGVDVDSRCGAMEVGACDLSVSYGLVGGAAKEFHAGPDDTSSVLVGALMLSGADAVTTMCGFEVTVTDRDPFSDDLLGSCTVAVRKQHLARSFKDPAGVEFETTCAEDWITVRFMVQVSPG